MQVNQVREEEENTRQEEKKDEKMWMNELYTRGEQMWLSVSVCVCVCVLKKVQ